MRFLFLFITGGICLGADCLAQQPWQTPATKNLFFIKAVYRFAEFMPGTIVLRNGIISSVKFNYDILTDQVHFIDQKGDTLMLALPDSVNFINLNGSRFYYDKGFLQTIQTTDGMILAFRQVLFFNMLEKVSPYNSGKNGSYFFAGNGQKIKLENGDKIEVKANEYYFFGGESNHFDKADKQFILNRYKTKEAEVNSFIKTNHTNFNKLEDLLLLLEYCSKLSS